MQQTLLTFGLAGSLLLLTACTSSEESGINRQAPITTEAGTPPALALGQAETSLPEGGQSAPNQGQSSKNRLTSRQDTVVASVTKRSPVRGTSERNIVRPPNPAYTVQVGAFSKAQNALIYQKRAKERFPRNSVHNRYDAQIKVYRVSIGKFTTRKEAVELRRDVIAQYPKEYEKAWVNYIAR